MLIAALVAASAALPPAQPPAPTFAGVRVSWPLKTAETAVAPGTRLTVRVKSPQRRSKLSFVRVNASGRALKVVARRTLRNGTFTVRVPAATVATRYALRIQVAGRKRWTWVTTSAPAPAPTPAPAPPVCNDRPFSGFRAAVQLAASQVRAGETLAYSLANVGEYELTAFGTHQLIAGDSYRLGREEPFVRLDPGASTRHEAVIPADTAPGSYRLLRGVSFNAACDAINSVAIQSEPFEVLAP